MHCSSELHLVDKVVRAPLHEPPLQGPRAPRGGNKGRFVGTGGRRWRAIIIVIIPIKKLIIGPGSPPADPIMGWFSSQPFIPPSLHSFTTEVRLQILSSPPHSPVVKAVAWSWFSAPCRRLWKHSFNMCVKPSMRPKPSNVCDDLHARNIELSLPDPRCAQKLGISGQLLATKSSQAAQTQRNGWLQKWLFLRECTCWTVIMSSVNKITKKETTFTKLFTNIQNRTSELDLLSDIFFLVPCGRKGFAAVWGFVEFVVTLNSRSAKAQPHTMAG